MVWRRVIPSEAEESPWETARQWVFLNHEKAPLKANGSATHWHMKLGWDTQVMRILLFVVSGVVAFGFWACDSAEPTPIEPTRATSPTAAPVLRVEPTSLSTPTVLPTEIPSPSATPTPTPTLEPTPTSTLVPTDTPDPTPTQTKNPTHTPAPTSTLTPTPVPTITPTSTVTPSPTATTEPEPEATAESAETISVEATIVVTWIDEDGIADDRIVVDEETLWGELFEELDEGELSCIRAALDEDNFEAVSARPVSSIVRFTDRHDLAVWGCLPQGHSVELYLSIFLIPELDAEGVELAEIEECFRSVMPYADLTRYIELTVLGLYQSALVGNDGWNFLFKNLEKCSGLGQADVTQSGDVPVFEIEPIVFVANPEFVWRDTIDSASLGEQTCIRGVLGQDRYETVRDEAIFDGSTESWESAIWGCLLQESAASLFKRVAPFRILRQVDRPIDNYRARESYRSATEIVEGDDDACLDRVLRRLDFPRLINAGLPDVGIDDYRHGMAAFIGIGLCVGSVPDIVDIDDHSDFIETATEIVMGSLVEGEIEDKFIEGWDVDAFKFTAEAGLAYELDLGLGEEGEINHSGYGLGAFNFKLYEEDQRYSSSTANSGIWEPTKSGTVYLIASGHRDLRYRIKITVADHDDDHDDGYFDDFDDFGDDVDSAHEITVGETVTGALTFAGTFTFRGILRFADDADVFSFAAEQDVNYQIEALSNVRRLGSSFERFRVNLIDVNGWPLRGVENRVIWKAPYSGQHYIRVAGNIPATYSISVSIPDLVDDHGDDPDSATTLELGETTHGAIGDDDDIDVFDIDLTQGETIEIDIDSSIKDDIYVDVWDDDRRGLFGGRRFPVVWTVGSGGPHVIRVSTP